MLLLLAGVCVLVQQVLSQAQLKQAWAAQMRPVQKHSGSRHLCLSCIYLHLEVVEICLLNAAEVVLVHNFKTDKRT